MKVGGKPMKKSIKIILLFLAVFLIATILNFPTKSYATSIVSSVYISGIDVPEAGNLPDTTGTTGKEYSIYGDIDWYNVTDDRFMTSGEKFAYGKTYRVVIWVKASSGYEFSTSGTSPNVTGYINNKVATVNKAYGEAAYEVVEVTYEFDLSVLRKLELSGGVVPSVGVDYPANNSWYVADGLHYTRTNTYTWYDVTDSLTMTSSNKTFKAGHIYRLTIVFEPENGYSFADISNMTAVLKNISASEYTAVVYKFAGDNNPKRYVEFTFNKLPTNDIKISNVTIKGGVFPYAGENPDFNLSVPANANYRISNSGADWYSPNENYHLTPTDTFIYGQTYYLDVYLLPNTGYCFDSIASMTATLPDVTGNFTVQIFEAGSNRSIRFIFTAKKPTYTVRFETGDMGSSVSSQQIEAGGYVTRPTPDPTSSLQGYTFENWYRNSRYTLLYDFNTPVNSNFTLYAKFVNNGVSGTINSLTASSNDLAEPVYNENMYIPTVTVNSVTPSQLLGCVTTSVRWSHNDTSIYQEDIMNSNIKFEAGEYTLYVTFESSNNDVTYNWANFPDDIVLNGITLTMDGCGESYILYSKTFSVMDNIELPFPDIVQNAWYEDAVKFAYANGLISGYGSGPKKGKFGPDDSITRSQIVSILWRHAGSPESSYEMSFRDVKDTPETWYYKAVRWAAENGIVTGYAGEKAGLFGPEDNITREQFALILQRYAAYCGKDSTTRRRYIRIFRLW